MGVMVEFTIEDVKKAYPELSDEVAKSVLKWLAQERKQIEKERLEGLCVTHPRYWRAVGEIMRGKKHG